MPKPCYLLIVVLCLCGNAWSQSLPYPLPAPLPNLQQQVNQGQYHPYVLHPVRRAAPEPSARQQAPLCQDTSRRLLYREDSTGVALGWLSPTSDGNLLSAGGYTLNNSYPSENNGYLVKFSLRGDTVWARRLRGGYPGRGFGLQQALELKNKDILVIGSMGMVVPYNGTSELFMARLTPDGRHLWHKTFRYKRYTDTTSGDFSITDVRESDAGELYLAGAYLYTAPAKGLLLMKFSASGTFLWSTDIYTNGGYPKGVGTDIVGSEVRLFGTGSVSPNSSIYNSSSSVIIARLDAATGDTLSVKTWGLPLDSSSWFRTPNNFMSLVKLANGNYAMAGAANGDNYTPLGPRNTYHFGVVEIGSNLQPLGGYSVQSDRQTGSDYSRITVLPDGSAVYNQMLYISGYSADMVTGRIENGQIVKERYIPYRGVSTIWTSNFLLLPGGGTINTRLNYDSATRWSGFEVMQLHNSDTSSACLGIDIAENRIVPLPAYIGYQTSYNAIYRNLVQETSRPWTGIVDEGLNRWNNCQQVSYCDQLQVEASDTVLCASGALQLRFRKNKACGSRPTWMYPASGVRQLVYLDDSTVQVSFTGPCEGWFRAQINSCTVLRDSVYVRVLKAPGALSLGADRELCAGNSLVLNARKGYASYRWQDGSADSLYTVTAPGAYWVTAADACGGVYADTVVVTAAPPIPFSAGPDRSKCNDDTLRLSAPPGFLNYVWGNNYNISALTTASVVVRPLVDTAYYVRAEKTPGCFARDTVRVWVYHSPPVDLGADRSFCQGDSAVFTAGSGFAQYLWSGGGTAPALTVKTTGTYSVIAVTAEGCRTYDTVRVVNVYANPIVTLDHATTLCAGTTRVLDAGSFPVYLWNDGSTARTKAVSGTGMYSVGVVDPNGCRGADTTVITAVLPVPGNFLPPDTAICSYGTLTLKPLRTFRNYSWSNAATTAALTITAPGIYWLQVRDDNNCTGRDTVLVRDRQCLKGVYVPTAFTPNGDGKNDVFRPLLFGDIKKYRFTVYNRWGMVVYQSNDPAKGWNGSYAGLPQDGGVFAWTCSYQLGGEEERVEKGTVLLMR